MTAQRKWLILLLLLLALAAMAALSAGLPRLRFNQGQVVSLPPEAEELAEQIGEDPGQAVGILSLQAVLITLLSIYVIYLLFNMLTRRGRRRVLNELIRIGVVLLFLSLLNQRSEELLEPPVETETPPMEIQLAAPDGQALEVTAIEPDLPRWAPGGLLVVGGLLLAGLAGAAAWWWFSPRQGEEILPEEARLMFASQAEQAALQIEAGQDVQDVILRTYYRMEELVKEERGIDRPRTMTPTEFAGLLAAYGLPRGALNELTRLFEAARYGSQLQGPEQEQRAVNALRAIAMSANQGPIRKSARLGEASEGG